MNVISPSYEIHLPAGPAAATILLVDDEIMLRQLAQHTLTYGGYRIISAGSGADALEAWYEHGSEVDLLLTDLVLPKRFTGDDLARQLQEEKPGLPVILSSGQSPEELADGVMFLQKPYGLKALLQMVERALGTGSAS